MHETIPAATPKIENPEHMTLHPTTPPPTDLTIPARDGYALAATQYGPTSAARMVVINSATATPRRFYRHFATALVEAGYRVVTYDYRGIGESRPPSLRGFPARMRDWAFLDMAGVLDWAREQSPKRLFLVGHSFGGQTAGLLDHGEAIDGMVTLSAQSGYWRLQGGEQKWTTAFHVHVTLPLLSHTVGFMPWSAVSGAEDLPQGVALEWARWCRQPGYLLDDATLPLVRYQYFRAPVLAYSIGDDKWGTPRSVDAMMQAYPTVTRAHLDPTDRGLKAIGHFGYFRRGSASLWTEAIDWFNAR